MIKFALNAIVSSLVLATAIPGVNVHAANKPAAKKQVAKKAVVARKLAASGKTATVKKAVASSSAKSSARRASFAPAAPILSVGDLAGLNQTPDPLALSSNAAIVVDQMTSQVLFEKNSDYALPIASVTKLMTAMVVLDANLPMDEMLEVTPDDIDREKHSASRLRVGAQLSRSDMLHIALMSSENRAASALGRNYPGGLPAFVAAMNAKARALGMNDTHYADPTGLSSRNVASARDLAKLVMAAYQYPLIRAYSTNSRYAVGTGIGSQQLQYMTSNRLVLNPAWDIGLQKTGYIHEAGHCLVMQARIDGRPVIMVFLDSKGKDSRLGDAGRVRRWLEHSHPPVLSQVASHQG